ncbi:MAG: DNA polymerase III subunit beta [Deltaproteobacteria bacterium]|nr:DNA polymerase III subunit beta [Deltaproteobacteria bacterium]
MTMNQTLIEKIVDFAKRYGATRLILFGSALERPEDARDIDIACDGIQGWKLYEMAARLEEELGAPLDIVPLSPPTRFTRFIEAKGKILL